MGSKKDIFGESDEDGEQAPVLEEGLEEGADTIVKPSRRAVDLFGDSDED